MYWYRKQWSDIELILLGRLDRLSAGHVCFACVIWITSRNSRPLFGPQASTVGCSKHHDTDTKSLWGLSWTIAGPHLHTSLLIAVTNPSAIHDAYIVSVSEFVIVERSLQCDFIVNIIFIEQVKVNDKSSS